MERCTSRRAIGVVSAAKLWSERRHRGGHGVLVADASLCFPACRDFGPVDRGHWPNAKFVLFWIDDGVHGRELRPSDGTATGPARVNGAGLSIGDISVGEPFMGTTSATFTVTLTAAWTASTVTVDYATADGTAHAGSDYLPGVGDLDLPAGGEALRRSP